MPVEIVRTGSSYDRNGGVGCHALDVRIGGMTHEFPALCAAHSDYEAGRASGVRIRADLFNYHHVSRDPASLASRATRDGMAGRIRRVQERHKPALTSITIAHAGGLPAAALREHYALQDSLPVNFISGADDPDWTLDQFGESLEELDRLDTDKEKMPTLHLRSRIGMFIDKLDYVMSRYDRFNLVWGGYTTGFARWEKLLSQVYRWGGWCNVVQIPRKHTPVITIAGQKTRQSNVGLCLLRGGSTYCHSWPMGMRVRDRDGSRGRAGRPRGVNPARLGSTMMFNRQTWCYDQTAHEAKMAAALSFNAVQDELGVAREAIRNGTFYDVYCPQKLALMDSLQKTRSP